MQIFIFIEPKFRPDKHHLCTQNYLEASVELDESAAISELSRKNKYKCNESLRASKGNK